MQKIMHNRPLIVLKRIADSVSAKLGKDLSKNTELYRYIYTIHRHYVGTYTAMIVWKRITESVSAKLGQDLSKNTEL